MIAPTSIPTRRANSVQVMKMAQALVELGHQVQLLAPQASGLQPAPTWEELAVHYGLREQFPVVWLPSSSWGRKYDYSYRAVHWARAWGADWVYTRLPQAAAFASLTGLATLLECHDLPKGKLGPLLFRLFLHGRGALRLVAITRALADALTMQAGACTIIKDPSFLVVAPDGVDLERYVDLPLPQAARQTLKELPEGRFTVGYTGHLYAGRGADLILTLAGLLPDVSFLIAGGEVSDVARVKEQARLLGLQNLYLVGFISNAELPRYQAACDLLIMPYQKRVAASSGGDIARYFSPMKLFEYLACGRPILCSNLPVLREVLNPHNAVLLPVDDVQSWADAIRALQTDPERMTSLAEQGRQDAQKYTWRTRAKLICDIEDSQGIGQ